MQTDEESHTNSIIDVLLFKSLNQVITELSTYKLHPGIAEQSGGRPKCQQRGLVWKSMESAAAASEAQAGLG